MSQTPDSSIDLSAYFERIGFRGQAAPSLDTLKALHAAHSTRIPFENIDVLCRVPIRLDLPSLQSKLVTARRGGYCFEQNSLFGGVLEQIGFDVTPLAARVKIGTQRMLPRTHMALAVHMEGETWLADVGFGGWGLIEPLPLAEGRWPQFDWVYQLARTADGWLLQGLQADNWQDLYLFTEERQWPVDYEPANYYVSNHPDSRFVQTLTAQLPGPNVRYILTNRDFVVARADRAETTLIDDDRLLVDVLRQYLGLDVEAGPWIPARAAQVEAGS